MYEIFKFFKINFLQIIGIFYLLKVFNIDVILKDILRFYK